MSGQVASVERRARFILASRSAIAAVRAVIVTRAIVRAMIVVGAVIRAVAVPRTVIVIVPRAILLATVITVAVSVGVSIAVIADLLKEVRIQDEPLSLCKYELPSIAFANLASHEVVSDIAAENPGQFPFSWHAFGGDLVQSFGPALVVACPVGCAEDILRARYFAENAERGFL